MFVENLSLIPTTQTTYIVSCDAADQKEIALGYRLSRAIFFFLLRRIVLLLFTFSMLFYFSCVFVLLFFPGYFHLMTWA